LLLPHLYSSGQDENSEVCEGINFSFDITKYYTKNNFPIF
jgi:hypothetical protein